nr:MAG TPA_asm: hypothetical protein [Caudoviricetes sp.]
MAFAHTVPLLYIDIVLLQSSIIILWRSTFIVVAVILANSLLNLAVCIHDWDASLQHRELKLKLNYYISKGFLYDSKDSSFVRGPIPCMSKKDVVEYLKDYIR